MYLIALWTLGNQKSITQLKQNMVPIQNSTNVHVIFFAAESVPTKNLNGILSESINWNRKNVATTFVT